MILKPCRTATSGLWIGLGFDHGQFSPTRAHEFSGFRDYALSFHGNRDQISPLHQANKNIANPRPISKTWCVHAPHAIGTRVRSRTASMVCVMYLAMYLPVGEFFSFSTLGGQTIIAPETMTGGANPVTRASPTLPCHR